MVMDAAIFFAGVAAGMITYRRIIIESIGHYPMTRCDYCKYAWESEKLFPRKK